MSSLKFRQGENCPVVFGAQCSGEERIVLSAFEFRQEGDCHVVFEAQTGRGLSCRLLSPDRHRTVMLSL